MLNLLSIFLSRAVTTARDLPARVLRTERGARTSTRRNVRIRVERTPERGVKTVLPKPGDAGVTGIAACDGNDGDLPALPMPLGLYTVGLLAGPAGMPEIAELPAPAEPAGGVSCASDDTGARTMSKLRASTADPWIIEVFSN
jgi:hypothetical protein